MPADFICDILKQQTCFYLAVNLLSGYAFKC